MNRPTILSGTALLATLVVLATLAGGVTAAVGPAATAPQVAANGTTNTTAENATAPGAQLAGVVGVQQAEVDGDLDNRTFGLRVANADSDEERAAIIAERQNNTRARLASQTDRLAELREARANGTISNAEYRARVATVAAQAADTERDAAQLNRTARKLPDAVRERANINVAAIEQLRGDARTLGGPETAAIARSVGGTTARNPMAGGARGPPMGTPGAGRRPLTVRNQPMNAVDRLLAATQDRSQQTPAGDLRHRGEPVVTAGRPKLRPMTATGAEATKPPEPTTPVVAPMAATTPVAVAAATIPVGVTETVETATPAAERQIDRSPFRRKRSKPTQPGYSISRLTSDSTAVAVSGPPAPRPLMLSRSACVVSN